MRGSLAERCGALDEDDFVSRDPPILAIEPYFSHISPLDPSGYVQIAIEHGPVEIVSFPIISGDFP